MAAYLPTAPRLLIMADTSASYWFAGLLTAVAIVIVVAVMLTTTETKDNRRP
ncbi:MAG: hypothetical protein WBM90_01855 [Acidimicrobiia bacterium]